MVHQFAAAISQLLERGPLRDIADKEQPVIIRLNKQDYQEPSLALLEEHPAQCLPRGT
jgi:hypothetical protein